MTGVLKGVFMAKRSGAASAEDSVLAARIENAVCLCERRKIPRFVGFLDERQALLAQRTVRSAGGENYLFWGGHEEAERVIFGIFPSFTDPSAEAFPLVPLTLLFRHQDELSHRDFLGALMALGIERETLGDILIEEGRAVLFVREKMASFVEQNLLKVGSAGVKTERGAKEPLPAGRGFVPISGTVASARLDCIISELANLSREKGLLLIRLGGVSLNHESVLAGDKRVSPQDKLTVKGYGKFVIDELGPLTKKGRMKFTARRYR